MLTTESCKRVNAIYRFVREHGLKAACFDNHVTIEIPYTSPTGDGFDTVKVSTMTEARNALGY